MWNIGEPGEFSGFRIYPVDTHPLLTDIKIVKKYREGNCEDVSSGVGRKKRLVILKARNAIRLDGIWLTKQDVPARLTELLRDQLED